MSFLTKLKLKHLCILFICVFTFFNLSYAQSNSESLISKLKEAAIDTIKIQLLIDVGDEYFYTFPDSSHNYYQNALAISKKINNKKFEALSLLNLGFYYDYKEYYQASLEYYLKAIELYKLINDQRGVADCYNYVGYSFAYLNSVENAFKYYIKSLNIYKKLNDSLGMAEINTGLGHLYLDLENYTKAHDYYSKSLQIYSALNDKEGVLSSYIDVGNAISENGDIQKGLDYYFKSVELSKELNDFEGLAVNYTNIGECYLDLGNYEKALDYSFKSNEVSAKNNYNLLYPLTYANIAKSYLKLKQYNKVVLFANKSLEASKNVSWANMEYDAHSYLSSAYEELGDYKKAYENHQIFKKFTDSIYNLKKVEQVTKLDILYKLEDHERKIDVLEKNKEVKTVQLKNQKLLSYALIIFSLFSIGLIVSLYKQRKHRKEAYNLLAIEKLKAEESDRLKSSFLANMSHEIRTPMNAIMGFTGFLKNPDLSPEKRSRFVEIINKSGDRLMTIINDIIDISKIESNQLKLDIKNVNVIETLKEIIEIQKKSNQELLNKNVEIKLQVKENLKDVFIKTDENRFNQILNNLIGNALKFTEKGYVEIGFYIKEYSQKKFIEFYVKDTGCGVPKDKFKSIFDRFSQAGLDDFKTGNGLGLSICKGLVTILKGKIWLESEKGVGTTFYFTLPY